MMKLMRHEYAKEIIGCDACVPTIWQMFVNSIQSVGQWHSLFANQNRRIDIRI